MLDSGYQPAADSRDVRKRTANTCNETRSTATRYTVQRVIRLGRAISACRDTSGRKTNLANVGDGRLCERKGESESGCSHRPVSKFSF